MAPDRCDYVAVSAAVSTVPRSCYSAQSRAFSTAWRLALKIPAKEQPGGRDSLGPGGRPGPIHPRPERLMKEAGLHPAPFFGVAEMRVTARERRSRCRPA